MDVMPKWAEVILVPLISLLLAAIISAFTSRASVMVSMESKRGSLSSWRSRL